MLTELNKEKEKSLSAMREDVKKCASSFDECKKHSDEMEVIAILSIFNLAFLLSSIEIILNGNRPISLVDNHIAICAGGLGFDSRVDQIRPSIANGSPPQQRFVGAEAPSRADGPRHSLHASA